MNINMEKVYQILKQAVSALSFDDLMSKTRLSDYELMSSLGTLSFEGKVNVSENDGKLFFAVA